MHRWQLPAPGDLDLVRTFLNTWSLEIATRTPRDQLPALARDGEVWQAHFPGAPRSPADSGERLARLRDDLRSMLGGRPGWAERLNAWLRDLPLYATVDELGEGAPRAVVHYGPRPEAGFVGRVLGAVVRALQEDTWSRLKACPDCQVVFYDHTRSRTKVWCGMLAGGPGGRACGTIAKVTRYRRRRRAQETAAEAALRPES